MNNNEIIKKIICQCLNISEVSDYELNKNNFPQWDSLTFLNIIISLQEKFKINFNPDDLIQMNSFKEIVEKINEKNN
ncbi:MAG TPA: acyl carrier protein [bacterium]|nr:acyl carrier protein [bacterium]